MVLSHIPSFRVIDKMLGLTVAFLDACFINAFLYVMSLFLDPENECHYSIQISPLLLCSPSRLVLQPQLLSLYWSFICGTGDKPRALHTLQSAVPLSHTPSPISFFQQQ